MIRDKGSTVKEVALDLARRGFAVFPVHYMNPSGQCSCGKQDCDDAGKHPMTPNGFKDSSTDPAEIVRLFRGSRSAANLAVATGPASGVWVLDEDGPEGMEVVEELQRQHGTFPPTVSSLTGRAEGGRHRFFRYPVGVEIKSRNKITLPGYGKVSIDIRGSGGYAILPPSNHASGRRYTWEHDPDSTPIVEAPDWLVGLVVGNGKPAETIVTTPTATETSLTFTVLAPVEDLATAPGAPKGQRHATALRLIGGAIGRGIDPVVVAQHAVEWARRCSPAMDETEVLKIVSDLGRKQAISITRQSTAARPLPPPPPPWEPFPINALPEPIRTYVRRASGAIGCDPAYIGTAILPTLAGAIGNRRQIILKRGWVEPAVLWGVLVGDSGTLKSPAIDAATRHVRRRQAAAMEVFRQAETQYEDDLARYKLNLDDWKRTGRRKGEPQPEEPEKPICERFSCSDVTVEGLAVLLSDAPRGLLLIRDELAGWIASFDQYKPGNGADTAHWLTIHGARDLLVDRKTGDRKTIFVRRAAVSVVGGIQPGTLRRALGREHFENGLAARLLLTMPLRREKKWTEAEIDEDLDHRIDEILGRLLDLEPHHGDDGPEPVVLGLTAGGKAAWIAFYDEHAGRLADATGDLAAVLSKIEGAAARLALIVHLVREAAGDRKIGKAIDEASITSGIALAQWYGREAERIYQVLSETDEDRQRRQVLDLIRRRGGTITANDLRRRSRLFATSEDAERFLDGLVKAGYGSWRDAGQGEAGGRPTREFTLSDVVSVSETQKPSENEEVSETEAPAERQERAEVQRSNGQAGGTSVSETPSKPEENRVSVTETAEAGGIETSTDPSDGWEEIRI
jgi:hypothetical protein